MSHCSGNHTEKENVNGVDFREQPPKSFIGRLIYNMGKKDYEEEIKNKQHKNKCC